MKRPWKVIDHRYNARGEYVERVASFASLEAAVRTFEVAVLFDIRARLEYRGTAAEL